MARPLSPAVLTLLLAGCAATGPPTADGSEGPVDAASSAVPTMQATGTMGSIDPDDARPARDLADLLVGRVPGLHVRPQPGGGVRVLIRGVTSVTGSNEPLVVVDGVPLSRAGGLPDINPADVASISVLKGSQAAIYGSRGAQGVILIRLKDGGR